MKKFSKKIVRWLKKKKEIKAIKNRIKEIKAEIDYNERAEKVTSLDKARLLDWMIIAEELHELENRLYEYETGLDEEE